MGGHTSELDKKLIKEKRNHTNTHKQTTKAIHPCVFNARVHYTVLTQHPNHTLPTQKVSTSHMVRHKKRGIMPQTPNNAPTYKQQLLFTVHGQQCVTKRHSNTWILPLRCVFHPDNFSTIKVGSMTLAYSTNQGCNCTRKIKAP